MSTADGRDTAVPADALPWTLTYGGILGNPQIRNTSGNKVLLEANTPWDRRSDVENAKYALVACNAFPALVEACKAALERIESDVSLTTGEGRLLRAALTLAGVRDE